MTRIRRRTANRRSHDATSIEEASVFAAPTSAARYGNAFAQAELQASAAGAGAPPKDLEAAFGADLASVQAHGSGEAANAEAGARAHATGTEITLSDPNPSGEALPHELAHQPTSRPTTPAASIQAAIHAAAEEGNQDLLDTLAAELDSVLLAFTGLSARIDDRAAAASEAGSDSFASAHAAYGEVKASHSAQLQRHAETTSQTVAGWTHTAQADADALFAEKQAAAVGLGVSAGEQVVGSVQQEVDAAAQAIGVEIGRAQNYDMPDSGSVPSVDPGMNACGYASVQDLWDLSLARWIPPGASWEYDTEEDAPEVSLVRDNSWAILSSFTAEEAMSKGWSPSGSGLEGHRWVGANADPTHDQGMAHAHDAATDAVIQDTVQELTTLQAKVLGERDAGQQPAEQMRAQSAALGAELARPAGDVRAEIAAQGAEASAAFTQAAAGAQATLDAALTDGQAALLSGEDDWQGGLSASVDALQAEVQQQQEAATAQLTQATEDAQHANAQALARMDEELATLVAGQAVSDTQADALADEASTAVDGAYAHAANRIGRIADPSAFAATDVDAAFDEQEEVLEQGLGDTVDGADTHAQAAVSRAMLEMTASAEQLVQSDDPMMQGISASLDAQLQTASEQLTENKAHVTQQVSAQLAPSVTAAQDAVHGLPDRIAQGKENAQAHVSKSWWSRQLSDLWDMISSVGFIASVLAGIALGALAFVLAPAELGVLAIVGIAALVGAAAAGIGTVVSNLWQEHKDGGKEGLHWYTGLGEALLTGAVLGGLGAALVEVAGVGVAGLAAMSAFGAVSGIALNLIHGEPWDKNLLANLLLAPVMAVLGKYLSRARGETGEPLPTEEEGSASGSTSSGAGESTSSGAVPPEHVALYEQLGTPCAQDLLTRFSPPELDDLVTTIGADRVTELWNKVEGDAMKHYGLDFWKTFKGVTDATMQHLIAPATLDPVGNPFSKGEIKGVHDAKIFEDALKNNGEVTKTIPHPARADIKKYEYAQYERKQGGDFKRDKAGNKILSTKSPPQKTVITDLVTNKTMWQQTANEILYDALNKQVYPLSGRNFMWGDNELMLEFWVQNGEVSTFYPTW